jgi:hypothetical protein
MLYKALLGAEMRVRSKSGERALPNHGVGCSFLVAILTFCRLKVPVRIITLWGSFSVVRVFSFHICVGDSVTLIGTWSSIVCSILMY